MKYKPDPDASIDGLRHARRFQHALEFCQDKCGIDVFAGSPRLVARCQATRNLLALQALTTAAFIPHPAGSDIGLGFVSTARLLDFPTSFVGAFSVPFMNVPLGFIAIAWWLGTALIAQPAYARYRVMVRGRPSARAVLWRGARSWLIFTTVLLLIATPFLRRYEIVTPDHLYVRHLFDWHERAYPLASLKAIHVGDPGTSRGIVTWDFIFDGDNRFTTTAPDIHALKYLLSNTHASANSSFVGNRLMRR